MYQRLFYYFELQISLSCFTACTFYINIDLLAVVLNCIEEAICTNLVLNHPTQTTVRVWQLVRIINNIGLHFQSTILTTCSFWLVYLCVYLLILLLIYRLFIYKYAKQVFGKLSWSLDVDLAITIAHVKPFPYYSHILRSLTYVRDRPCENREDVENFSSFSSIFPLTIQKIVILYVDIENARTWVVF